MQKLQFSLTTQGNTGTPSIIQLVGKLNKGPLTARIRVCNQGGYANGTNPTIAPTGGCSTLETHTSGKDLTVKSSVGAKAAGTLTLTGVAIDGEYVTLGGRTYELDANGSVASHNVAADISAYAAKAVGTLRLDTKPTAADTMIVAGRSFVFTANGQAESPGEISIGANLAEALGNIIDALNGDDGFNTEHATVSAAAGTGTAATATLTSNNTNVSDGAQVVVGNKTFVFKTALTPTEGEVLIGADADGSLLNLIRAINHTGTPGTHYSCAAAHTQVTAAASVTAHAFLITASLYLGSQGNALASTETSGTLSFGGTTFSGAVDKILLTAKTGGTAGNSLATTETFTASNNTFDAATLGTTTAGTACSAANAVIALVAAIAGDADAVVAGTANSDAMDVEALSVGTAGNSLASTKSMANGSFGGSVLSGGTNADDGIIHLALTNATAETVTLRCGPPLLNAPGDVDYTLSLDVRHAAP